MTPDMGVTNEEAFFSNFRHCSALFSKKFDQGIPSGCITPFDSLCKRDSCSESLWDSVKTLVLAEIEVFACASDAISLIGFRSLRNGIPIPFIWEANIYLVLYVPTSKRVIQLKVGIKRNLSSLSSGLVEWKPSIILTAGFEGVSVKFA
uniref:Uncharacterized protein n=1 Tax=Rhizophagus irregularis (strain DAOM 181602 / DAOM 197198 / MUCL 43194) TaxID=747089 RepID=U9SQJ4_RHIID